MQVPLVLCWNAYDTWTPLLPKFGPLPGHTTSHVSASKGCLRQALLTVAIDSRLTDRRLSPLARWELRHEAMQTEDRHLAVLERERDRNNSKNLLAESNNRGPHLCLGPGSWVLGPGSGILRQSRDPQQNQWRPVQPKQGWPGLAWPQCAGSMLMRSCLLPLLAAPWRPLSSLSCALVFARLLLFPPFPLCLVATHMPQRVQTPMTPTTTDYGLRSIIALALSTLPSRMTPFDSVAHSSWLSPRIARCSVPSSRDPPL